ncbi:MAG: TlpA family protein disulfide reductase [Acidimicrobiia bacterium]|nr:TlpA family protein disulfide reductase [Acidimicrobiia bacterium]NNF08881.1 TlpA family protein disulfide reductase [Acidimicrobiia bacterium]
MRRVVIAVCLAVAAAACGGSDDVGDVGLLPEITPDELQTLIADTDRPLVLNVWASWCIPCRSEAPLLRTAHEQFGDEVRFVGLDVRDNQSDARAFLNEFDLAGFEHYFDQSGAAQGSLGAGGVPLTLFYRADGSLFELHFGVIDERTLALNLDEIGR